MWVLCWTKIPLLYFCPRTLAMTTKPKETANMASSLYSSSPVRLLTTSSSCTRPTIQPAKTWWRRNSIWWHDGSQPWLHIRNLTPRGRPGFLKNIQGDSIVHPRMRIIVFREKSQGFEALLSIVSRTAGCISHFCGSTLIYPCWWQISFSRKEWFADCNLKFKEDEEEKQKRKNLSKE